MKLNQWDAAAMEAAIDEYNKLCQDHGLANVSIKSVAVKNMVFPQQLSGRGTFLLK